MFKKAIFIIVFGLPGAGKTYFASQLAARIRAHYVSSDQVRKSLFPLPDYSPDEKKAVYEKMIGIVKEKVADAKPFIIEATFYQREMREAIKSLATTSGAVCRWIEVYADEETIKKRLMKRRKDSDADFEVYKRIKNAFEPFREPHLKLESKDGALQHMIDSALKYIQA